MPRALSGRRAAFVEAYTASGNASVAARAAGYSMRSAYSTGSRLLRNAEIRNAIAEIRERVLGSIVADAKMVLAELSALALAGEVAADPLAGARLRAKVQALTVLAKHHGLLDGPKGGSMDQERINAKLAEVADLIQGRDGSSRIDGGLGEVGYNVAE